MRHVFLFVGADPETSGSKVAAWRATRTASCSRAGAGQAPARPRSGPSRIELPGVFAVGDVRSGSVKRVGAAIGEGPRSLAAIHEHLAVAA